MPTNLVIDDRLIEEAQKLGKDCKNDASVLPIKLQLPRS